MLICPKKVKQLSAALNAHSARRVVIPCSECVRTAEENLSNVRVALPSDFITTGCLNQRRRASLWSQHTTACVCGPGFVAVRRGVGCCRNMERQLRCCTCGHRSRERWRCHRPKARLNSRLCRVRKWSSHRYCFFDDRRDFNGLSSGR